MVCKIGDALLAPHSTTWTQLHFSTHFCHAGSYYTAVRLIARSGFGNMSQVLTVVPNVTYTLSYGLTTDSSATDNETNTNYWRTMLGSQVMDELIGIPAPPADGILNRQLTYRVPPQTTQVVLQFTFRNVCPCAYPNL
jgi:hypothetical protein